jgi:hypothetical protein
VAALPTEQRAHERFLDFVRAKDGPGAEAYWRSHLKATTKSLAQGHEGDAVIDVLERVD